ncbi:LysM peptidoglycan-binding domain-containing protein [[Mycobacterium] appelbergii]|uniref:LysM peptidoglycan-binding domain-containing protein n=1 Tax=[Mycobacterium] appelbergii TaxID=2939269 RepID=UPI0039774891
MVLLDTRVDSRFSGVRVLPDQDRRPVRRPVRGRPTRRPGPVRPAGAALQHRGTGVLMSRASHRRPPITPATTVLLALVAAGITVWLGLVAQFGGVMGQPEPVPTELAVVQVQSGETLQHVARRVAPDAPVAQVVEQIRDLNQLESAAVDAGQTLIAPVG